VSVDLPDSQHTVVCHDPVTWESQVKRLENSALFYPLGSSGYTPGHIAQVANVDQQTDADCGLIRPDSSPVERRRLANDAWVTIKLNVILTNLKQILIRVWCQKECLQTGDAR
jgi:hypothetical protein